MRDDTLKKFGTYDAALARVRELEAKLGMPQTQAFDDICKAWDRIEALEDVFAARGSQPGSQTAKSAAALNTPTVGAKPLYGLARVMAANGRH